MSKLSKAAIFLLKIYQRTISPDHGNLTFPFFYGACKFYPSCSNYACATIVKFGLLRGCIKSAWRVLRCNPFSRGGYDPA